MNLTYVGPTSHDWGFGGDFSLRRKVTAKEQQEWKIPPCISNWKNARGYTIPLDKRLAADGRGLQQVGSRRQSGKLMGSDGRGLQQSPGLTLWFFCRSGVYIVP